MKEAPKNKTGINTVNKLVETSLDLMWKNSYGRVTIDQICECADVKKGSFYHFFDSKNELTKTIFDESWKNSKLIYDEIFSPDNSPVKRFQIFCKMIYDKQKESYESSGFICGCPLMTLGSELANHPELREQANCYGEKLQKYFKAAIIEGISNKDIPDCNATEVSSDLYTTLVGILTRARISNDLNIITRLPHNFGYILNISLT